MAQNSISYTGRIRVRDGEKIKHTRTEAGMHILELVIAEDHSMKKGRALKDPKLKKYAEDPYNASKGADEYIRTTTSWHRLTIFGDKAAELAQDPDINAGALIEVNEASYTEDEPWETKDGVKRAGRPETIGDQRGGITVVFPPREEEARPPIWDGVSDVPKPGGSGNGGGRQYREDEGF